MTIYLHVAPSTCRHTGYLLDFYNEIFLRVIQDVTNDGDSVFLATFIGDGNGNGLLFHMTQPISRSTIKAIACSKPIISEN